MAAGSVTIGARITSADSILAVDDQLNDTEFEAPSHSLLLLLFILPVVGVAVFQSLEVNVMLVK